MVREKTMFQALAYLFFFYGAECLSQENNLAHLSWQFRKIARVNKESFPSPYSCGQG